MKLDYLIIGQGLAGTLLGFELMKAGNSVHYIDAPDFRKASNVAAGLINPVVFRRLTKSWMVDELYPHMLKTYADLENLLGRAFFFPMKICKVFGQGEADFWRQKSIDNQLETYLTVEPDFKPRPFLNLPHGCGWVEKKRTGRFAWVTWFLQKTPSATQLITPRNFRFHETGNTSGRHPI